MGALRVKVSARFVDVYKGRARSEHSPETLAVFIKTDGVWLMVSEYAPPPPNQRAAFLAMKFNAQVARSFKKVTLPMGSRNIILYEEITSRLPVSVQDWNLSFSSRGMVMEGRDRDQPRFNWEIIVKNPNNKNESAHKYFVSVLMKPIGDQLNVMDIHVTPRNKKRP